MAEEPSQTAEGSPASNSLLPDKPRLTEQEKKSNHIASEQKRRQAIREGFDEIAELVPGLKGQGRSEAVVLGGAIDYMRRLLAERWNLLLEGNEKGIDVSHWELDDLSMGFAKDMDDHFLNCVGK